MLTDENFLQQRLHHQQVASCKFQTPGNLVKWMGAMQAQDYPASLWAIGLRIHGISEKDVEKVIANKKIIRTWPMRGTLHFVAPEDVRWMLQLLTPRIVARSAGIYKTAGLDDKIFSKSRKLIAKELEGDKQLTRAEIYALLEKAKVSTGAQRGLHILGRLAQEGLICLAARKGKQQTFSLLEEWVPKAKILQGDEALNEIALRYFSSHGPATVYDFSWWSGLTTTEAKKALQMAQHSLVKQTKEGRDYWSGKNTEAYGEALEKTYLLPNFDEYAVGYTDRQALVDDANERRVKTSFSFLNASIITNGKITGFWKRSLTKDEVLLEAKVFSTLSKTAMRSLEAEAKRYGNFLGMPVKLILT